jgi:CubicO group peptidase (beta-lactamase class C family)
VPGVAVASVFGKRIVSFGSGVVDNNDQATASTVFEAASLSKPTFALGVLQLVEAGKPHLDSPITTIVDLRHETDDPRVLRITPTCLVAHDRAP